jgi:hypothetical protein
MAELIVSSADLCASMRCLEWCYVMCAFNRANGPGTPPIHSFPQAPCLSLEPLQEDIKSTPLSQICLLILAGAALHLTFLAVNFVVTKHVLHLSFPELKAVLIMGSQKTLPVSVTIINYFPASFGTRGLLTLPCIMGHMAQLFIDAMIVSRWASLEEKRMQAEMVCFLDAFLLHICGKSSYHGSF